MSSPSFSHPPSTIMHSLLPQLATSIPPNCLLFQQNCRTLQGKIFEYRSLLRDYHIPLICFSEANARTSSLPRISNYVAYGESDSTYSRVITYVDRHFTQRPRPINNLTEGLHAVAVDVRFPQRDITIVNVYVTASRYLREQDFLDLLSQLPQDNVILTGDFNAHHPAWGSTNTTPRGTHLLRALGVTSLLLLNDGVPTFGRRTTHAPLPYLSCLDLTFTSPDLFNCASWQVYFENFTSDHYPTLTSLTFVKQPSVHKPLTDWVKYRDLLSSQDPSLMSPTSLQEAMANAYLGAQTTCKEPAHAPSPDMTLKHLQATRRRAYRRYLRSGNLYDRQEADRTIRILKKHRKLLAWKRWRDTCQKVGHSTTSDLFRMARGMSSTPAPSKSFQSAAYRSGLSTEEALLAFTKQSLAPSISSNASSRAQFQSKAASAVSEYVTQAHSPLPAITQNELIHVLGSCSNGSAPGADGLRYTMIKSLPSSFLSSIVTHFNSFLTAKSFPDLWKTGHMTPIPKPGKPHLDLDNYRPITKLPCLGKVYERVLKGRLDHHLENGSIFREEQTAYRRGRSCWDNIVTLLTSLEDAKANREITGIVFLDISRAFDTCDHLAVLYECVKAKVNPQLVSVIQDYLRDRLVQGQLGSVTTSPLPVSQGVPQGGVLSPLLFNVLLHRMFTKLPSHVQFSVFADDVVIWVSSLRKRITFIEDTLQDALDHISSFLNKRGLVVSAQKTRHMVVGSTHQLILDINDRRVCHTSSHRFLGITINDNLRFTAQRALHRQASISMGHVIRMFRARNRGLSSRAAMMLTYAIMHSKLLYALPFLSMKFLSERNCYISIQAHLCRSALGLLRGTSSLVCIAESGGPPLHILALQRLQRYFTRLRYNFPNHPLLFLLATNQGRLADLYRQTTPLFTLPVSPSSLLLSVTPPWQIHTTSNLSIPRVNKKALTTPTVCRALVNEHLAKTYHPSTSIIYTDGSVESGSAAAAAFFPASGHSVGRRLPYACSSTTAELAGILLAVITTQPNDAGVLICCDSKAAIQCVQSPTLRSCNPGLVNLIHQAVHRLGCPVALQWVPAHVGVAGNERADTSARAAHHLPSTPGVFASPRSLYQRIAESSSQIYNEWFFTLPPAYLSNISPSPTPLLAIRIPSPRFHTVVHRIRANKGITPSHLFHLRKTSSPNCSLCQTYGDISHLILHCARYSTERTALAQALSSHTQEPLSIRLITSAPLVSHRNLLYAYLVSTRLLWTL